MPIPLIGCDEERAWGAQPGSTVAYLIAAWNQPSSYWKIFPEMWTTAERAAQESQHKPKVWSHFRIVQVNLGPKS